MFNRAHFASQLCSRNDIDAGMGEEQDPGRLDEESGEDSDEETSADSKE